MRLRSVLRGLKCAIASSALVLTSLMSNAMADEYPSRPVRIIVPFAAGGSIDFVARLAAKELSASLGQRFIVENRTGASGKLGVIAAKQAEANDYTLLLITGLTHGINPALRQDLGYDPVKDFEPAVQVGSSQTNFMIRSDPPAKNVKELIDLIRSKPGQFSFGTGGTGSANHMMGVVFLAQAGLPADSAIPVAYRGAAPAFADLLSGRVQFIFATGQKAHVDNGTLRVIATTGRIRSIVYPEAPTMTELGLDDVYYNSWYGLSAPANTPPRILKLINDAAAKFLVRPDVKKILAENGLEPGGGSIDDFRKTIADDLAHWQRVVSRYKLAETP